MFTPELAAATMQERGRQAAEVERQSIALNLLREDSARHGARGSSSGRSRLPRWLSELPFVSLLVRESRATSAP